LQKSQDLLQKSRAVWQKCGVLLQKSGALVRKSRAVLQKCNVFFMDTAVVKSGMQHVTGVGVGGGVCGCVFVCF